LKSVSWQSARWWAALAAVIVAAAAVVILLGQLEDRLPDGSTAAVPAFSHVYVLVLENKAFDAVVGSDSAPYLSGLAARYGVATNYDGLFHPSQPNYLAMVSGSRLGVEDDASHDLDAPTLFDQLESRGLDWRVAVENVPDGCFTGATAQGGPDGPGTYVRKHNPAISFTAIRSSAERCEKITPLSAFDPMAAEVQFIVPNLCHDMHDCSVADGDAWLSSWVPDLLASPGWREGGVLFITFDESSDKDAEARVATFVIASSVPPGARSGEQHDHYALLRTIEDAFDLDCLAGSCSANPLGEFFPASS
jgi:phospholipase C